MPAFEYKALDGKGRNKKGILEADTQRQARQQLRDMGLIPVAVEAAAASEKRQAKGGFSLQRSISAADLALITRQLATLIQSGLPIESALLAVAEQCEKPRLQKMMMAVRTKVVEGFSLADGLAEFPHVFDTLFRAMVAAGEKSGHLDPVLERLADYTEQRQFMRSQIIQALVYPAILVVFAITIIAVLLTAVVPKILSQFEKTKQALPWTTEFILSASHFLQSYGMMLLTAVVLLIVAIQRLLQRPALRYRVDKRLLTMPGLGKISRGLNTARFARTLAILSSSAVPLLEGMNIAAGVLANLRMKEAVSEAASRVKEGASLRAALAETKLFPPMMMHMIASGEKSGELEQMLTRAADNQDREFSTLVNVSLKMLEPIMIALMAGMVLFIVMAILQPILLMNKSVGL